MGSNPFIWVTEGGDINTTDRGVWPAAAPACVCRLHALVVRLAALVSDESALEACTRVGALYKLTPLAFFYIHKDSLTILCIL